MTAQSAQGEHSGRDLDMSLKLPEYLNYFRHEPREAKIDLQLCAKSCSTECSYFVDNTLSGDAIND